MDHHPDLQKNAVSVKSGLTGNRKSEAKTDIYIS
jgi:hypothetical protein